MSTGSSVSWLAPAAKEARLAARLLVRSPGVSAIAAVALVVGIGLTTAMFSIVNGTILRGLPLDKTIGKNHGSGAACSCQFFQRA